MGAVFGTAGNPQDFYDRGFKHSLQMPEYLYGLGLGAYEYQCGRGVSIGAETATAVKAESEKYGIVMSLHSPYFISLSTDDADKAANNIRYIVQSAEAVRAMGGTRVVVHSGSCGKTGRAEALARSKANLARARRELDDRGMDDVVLCPETMGKINQLGTLEEVLELCGIDERFIPCVDFGHLNARTLGGIKSREDFEHILDEMENALGRYRAERFHVHFSKIEYSSGGEVRHLTFEDNVFGPDFGPFAAAIAARDYSPVIICESAGTQGEDAVAMQNMLRKAETELKIK